MRVKGQAKKERDAKIARMLAEGQPAALIATETGANVATVYRHRAAVRQADFARIDGHPVGEESRSLIEVCPDVGLSQRDRTIVELYAAGVASETIGDAFEIDLEAIPLTGNAKEVAAIREGQVMARLAKAHPARWVELVEARRIAEQRARERTDITRDEFSAFFGDVLGHLNALLTESDMRHFVFWVEELAKYRHTKLA